MTQIIHNLHFLRPLWLLALVPALCLAILILRRHHGKTPYEGVIAPHLLAHLLTGQDKANRLRPAGLLILFWCLAVTALAGPSWKKAPSPFTEDTSALVIAVKVTPSMTAEDIRPSRLTRASHKVRDLLALRPGARTALVAYAGSAHLVMPLTRDATIITTFAGELSPEIMPEEGDQAAAALALAAEQLEKNNQPGSILLMADSVDPGQLKALEAHAAEHRFPVHILAVAADKGVPVPPDSPPAPPLDAKRMKQAADAVDASLTIISPDDRDIKALNRRIESTPVDAGPPEEGEHWQDSGYALVPLLTLLSLMWFRPGWRVRWR
ncbi:VWA domain-containing protein [Desulfoluna butyratoxydans]|uniref:von willebrand factor type a n=1 Tax=Desulfoluna butyratoxydans TaxID=231438 RepID=A0A4U8YU37_9BACT|nr:VWA domain-containing protein [Desulfoluna butyratoxydans]VFQ47500.1 von willebrand factor type a [Desulfoluna butyratoxydans]